MAHNNVGVSDFVKERLLQIRGDLRIFKDLDPDKIMDASVASKEAPARRRARRPTLGLRAAGDQDAPGIRHVDQAPSSAG